MTQDGHRESAAKRGEQNAVSMRRIDPGPGKKIGLHAMHDCAKGQAGPEGLHLRKAQAGPIVGTSHDGHDGSLHLQVSATYLHFFSSLGTGLQRRPPRSAERDIYIYIYI